MMTQQPIKSCCAISRKQFTQQETATIQENKESLDFHQQDEQFAYIPKGIFLTGTTNDDPDLMELDGEANRQEVIIKGFYLAKTPVTNAQFAEFVEATGYVTEAETFGWSFVFHIFVTQELAIDILGAPEETPWWRAVSGANWRHPEGRFSSIDSRLNHPVVHVSWNDAQAYAKWANKRLPTEAEWEYAAAGGMVNQKFPWGNTLTQDGKHHANVWQGEFPNINSYEDGYIGTAPVNAFEANAFGLYTMIGNIWEWSADTFTTHFPNFMSDDNMKLIKGGSYLCHSSYCNRYRIAARTFNTIDSSTGHMGFRLAYDE